MKIKDQYTFRQIEDVTFLVKSTDGHERAENLFTLNETGVFLCSALREERGEEELLSLLAGEYEIEEVQLPAVRSDLQDFLDKLRALDILEEE